MEQILKSLLLVLLTMTTTFLISCGDDDNEPQNSTNPYQYSTFKEPCLKWGATKAYVKSFMNGYKIDDEDDVYLIYSGKYKEFATVYVFNDSKLQYVGVYVPCSKVSFNEIFGYLDERYRYVGEVDDYLIFLTKEGNNTVGLGQYTLNSTLYYSVIYAPSEIGAVRKRQDAFIEEINSFLLSSQSLHVKK